MVGVFRLCREKVIGTELEGRPSYCLVRNRVLPRFMSRLNIEELRCPFSQ